MKKRAANRSRGAVTCVRALAICGAALGAPAAHALTITPIFDASITGDTGHTSAIENAIDTALRFYRIFTNPITVTIDFQLAPSNATYLGGSISSYYITPYADYTSSLLSNAVQNTNGPELTGYEHLSSGNKSNIILATSADLRALSYSGAPGIVSSSGNTNGTFDGVVYLNAKDLTNFGGTGNYNSNRVIQHEVDEVLGIGGSGSVLNIMQDDGLSSPPVYRDNHDPTGPLNGTYIGALDLFRYSAPGTPSLTTSNSASSYFSLNGGVTDIAPFNQTSSVNNPNDYGDWGGSGCIALVQQAASCANQFASLTTSSPEVKALESIGYDLPEPATFATLGVSLLGLGWARRRRHA